jgi:hypothetical protein
LSGISPCYVPPVCGADGVTFAIDSGSVPAVDAAVLYASEFRSRPVGAKAAEENWQRCEKDWKLRTKQSPWVGRRTFKDTAVGAAMAAKTLRRLVVSVVFPRPLGTYTPPATVSVDKLTVHVQVTMDNGHVLFDPSIMDVFSRVYSGAGGR